MTYEKQRFRARAGDGSEYEIIEYGSRIETPSLSGRSSIEGLSEFRTGQGWAVNRIDAETYKVVRTDQVVRKIG